MNGGTTMKLEDLSEEEMRHLASPLESFEDIQSNIEWSSMDEDWKQRLIVSGNGWWLGDEDPPDSPDEVYLRDLLLSIAGDSVCMPYIEEDLNRIINRGILWDGSDPVMMRGRPSQCHSNSAYCWDSNRDKVTIATGYAMSYDGGVWRQHSWCVGLDDPVHGPYIIETTEPREAYFGFPMTYEECERFLYDND